MSLSESFPKRKTRKKVITSQEKERQTVKHTHSQFKRLKWILGKSITLKLRVSTQPESSIRWPGPKPTIPMVGGKSPTLKSDTFESVGGFLPPKLDPPNPTVKPTKFSNIWRFSNKNLQKIDNIWNFLTKIYLKSTRFGKISTGFREISLDLVRSSTDLVEISSDLTRSQQIQWGLAKSDEDLGWIQAVSTIA